MFPPWFAFSSYVGAKRAEVSAQTSKLTLGKNRLLRRGTPSGHGPLPLANDLWDMERI